VATNLWLEVWQLNRRWRQYGLWLSSENNPSL